MRAKDGGRHSRLLFAESENDHPVGRLIEEMQVSRDSDNGILVSLLNKFGLMQKIYNVVVS